MDKKWMEVTYYNAEEQNTEQLSSITELNKYNDPKYVYWFNFAGLDKEEIHQVCQHFCIHYLYEEDIVHKGQRPKIDVTDEMIYCLMYRLQQEKESVKKSKSSLFLIKNCVINLQESCENMADNFAELRKYMQLPNSRIKQKKADFLYYALIDNIVDNYLVILDKLGDRIEFVEGHLSFEHNRDYDNSDISKLRHALMKYRKTILPVNEIIDSFLAEEKHNLIDTSTIRYFKDIADHMRQITDTIRFYQESIATLQDLYMNKINTKMNESMNLMTIITCLLAPTTVLAGIFGMNFKYMPFLDHRYSFYVLIGLLIFIFIVMVYYLKKKKWL